MDKIIAGRRPILEALRAGTRIEKIVFASGIQGKVISEIRKLAHENGIPIAEVEKGKFRELARHGTAQGVIAVVPARRLAELEDILNSVKVSGEKGFLLLLDEIEDPHNLGALIRTAECAGVHGVITPKHHAASVTSTVVKSSAGATEHVAMAEVTNVVSTIEMLKQEEYWVVGLDASGEKLFAEVDYTTPVVVIVGNEGKGIRRLVKEHCDFLVRVPLLGKIRSLNASVAGALVLYEVVRQRTKT